MKIRLLPHQIYFVLGLVISVNLIMLSSTRLFHFYYYDILAGNWEKASSTKYALLEFSLGTENNCYLVFSDAVPGSGITFPPEFPVVKRKIFK